MQLIVLFVLVLCLFRPMGAMAEDAVAAKECRVLDSEISASYQGECDADGWADGYGVARGADGVVFAGQFKAGKKNGVGVKTWKSGSRYIGQFVDDAKEGYGVYEWQEPAWRGERYMGQYKQDKRDGEGVYEWPSGERYRGLWQADKMIGEPTPMMLLRGQHQAAVDKSVKKVGVKVCREMPIGIVNKEIISGMVDSVVGEQISIKLIDAGSTLVGDDGQRILSGQTITDSPMNWLPCY